MGRSREMAEWIPIIEAIRKRGAKPILLYFNNHYAGYAPGSVREFMRAWHEYHGHLSFREGGQ